MKPVINNAGFTLLELLVALSIFALVSTMAYGGLQVVLETRARVQAEGERLGELQLVMGVIARDLSQHIDRTWRDQWGEPRASIGLDRLALEPRLELIRAGGRPGHQRSELRRIGYELDDGVLYRLMWAGIDGGGAEPHGRTRLAGDTDDPRRRIEGWRVEFYYRDTGAVDGGGDGDRVRVTDGWPPTGEASRLAELKAVEVILDLERGGTLRRLLPVNSGAEANPLPQEDAE